MLIRYLLRDSDQWILREESRKEIFHRKLGHTNRTTDRDIPRQAVFLSPYCILCILHFIDDRTSVSVESLSELGDVELSCRPLNESCAHSLFELSDVPAQPGFRQTESLGCGREPLLLDHMHEVKVVV